ncbi:MAG: NUDIX hydrolase [Actinomycetota bacterium]
MADDRSPLIGVGAIVVREGSILMVKRGKEPAKGLWSVPGGRLEHGEYITQAVAREVKEETGLDVEVGELLGVFEVVGDTHYVILDHVATVSGEQQLQPGSDAEEVRWVKLEDVATLDCTPRFEEALKAWGIL